MCKMDIEKAKEALEAFTGQAEQLIREMPCPECR